jgi:hypothetical protein
LDEYWRRASTFSQDAQRQRPRVAPGYMPVPLVVDRLEKLDTVEA